MTNIHDSLVSARLTKLRSIDILAIVWENALDNTSENILENASYNIMAHAMENVLTNISTNVLTLC